MRLGSLAPALFWIYNRLIPGFLLLSALMGFCLLGQALEWPVHDLLARCSAKPAIDSPVTLVLIDDESILRLNKRFGPMPWSRSTYLEIFHAIRAKNPQLLVFDGHFLHSNQAKETSFFKALNAFPDLISGVIIPETLSTHPMSTNTIHAYYRPHVGVVNLLEDGDGVIRRLKTGFHWARSPDPSGVMPAISVATALDYLGKTHAGAPWMLNLPQEKGEFALRLIPQKGPGISLPLDNEASFQLRWYRLRTPHNAEYAHSHPAISLWRFFDSSSPVSTLQGRIALLGSSSSFYRDFHRTPMAHRHSGPDIHATAIDNILNRKAIWRLPPWLNLLVLCLFCWATFQVRLRLKSFGKTLFYTLGAMIIYFWLAFWLLSEKAVWIDVATPELFVGGSFLAGSIFRTFFKEKALAAMERNMAQLVDPEVFREIRRRSHVLKPGGQNLEITSMFVDIRHFTALAERLQPEDVTNLLNAFYSAIVTVVFRYQGTIDKFMGDGILIIFGAPLSHGEHRTQAIRAAVDILEATGNLSTDWKLTRGISADIGVTLNSGPAFVGFLGPAYKLEYTAVGDTVNISVRLQEHTQFFHTRLLVTAETLMGAQEALKDLLTEEDYLPLGKVLVRGRESAIEVYTLRQALLSSRPTLLEAPGLLMFTFKD
jgi:adenylate cyclase